MKMLVCVKQVPDTTEIKIDPVKNTLIRDGVPSILNPFDGYALEAAARIKDADPDSTITVVSMGPEQANAVLKESLAIAADNAYLVSGREFGGSDTLCTSYILSEAIKEIEKTEGKFDIIFCGKQAIDGDTGQVGPGIAEHLDYPQITYALEASVEDGMVKVKKETEDGAEIVGIQTLAFADLPDIDPDKIGLKNSPTRVKKTFVPQKKTGGIKIQEEAVEDSTKKLFQLLSDAHVI